MTVVCACRAAMRPGAELLTVGLVAAERSGTDERHPVSALMDLYMMSLFGKAKKRSLAELAALFTHAGLGIDQYRQFPSGLAATHASAK